jgi:hypothetical protein
MEIAGSLQAARLDRSALTARRGYALVCAWDVYAAVVGDTLVDYDAHPLSAADALWVELHDGSRSPAAEALRSWLGSNASVAELDAELRRVGGPNAREVLSSHPYPDVYAWSLRRMFPPLSRMPQGLRTRVRSSSSEAPR